MAAEDLKEKTAILDARFLGGDEKLHAQFDKALINDVLNRNQQSFFQAKLEESRERHKQYGESIYLLEPQLKEGEGGLRDLHTALWLAKVKYKVHSLEELVQKAIITEPELNEVNAARDFLCACATRCTSSAGAISISSPSNTRNRLRRCSASRRPTRLRPAPT